jgi:hypothetical protein
MAGGKPYTTGGITCTTSGMLYTTGGKLLKKAIFYPAARVVPVVVGDVGVVVGKLGADFLGKKVIGSLHVGDKQ